MAENAIDDLSLDVALDPLRRTASASLATVRADLSAEFGSEADEQIDLLVRESFARPRGARVQTLRILLAELEVRAALRDRPVLLPPDPATRRPFRHRTSIDATLS